MFSHPALATTASAADSSMTLILNHAGVFTSEISALIAPAAMGKQGDVNICGAVTHEQIEKSMLSIWQDAEPRDKRQNQKCTAPEKMQRSAFEANETDSDREVAQALSSDNDSEHEAKKPESASDFETYARLYGETLDSEDESALAEALVAKHEARI